MKGDILLSCSSCTETTKILCGQLNVWVYNCYFYIIVIYYELVLILGSVCVCVCVYLCGGIGMPGSMLMPM